MIGYGVWLGHRISAYAGWYGKWTVCDKVDGHVRFATVDEDCAFGFSFWQVPSPQPMLHKGSPSMRGCDSEDRRCIYATAHITYRLAVGFLFSS